MLKPKNILKKPQEMLDNPSQSAILGAIILFLVLLLIFLSGYFFTRVNTYQKAPSKNLGAVTLGEDEPKEFEKSEIYGYTGIVTKVTFDTVYFTSTYIEDMNIIESEIEAKVEDGTTLLKKDLYELYKTGPGSTESTGATLININEIKIGDQITAYSNNNIKYKTSYPASKIEVVYQSQEY